MIVPRRAFNAQDVAVTQTLAERAAPAIDNARRYFESQAAIVARDQCLVVASTSPHAADRDPGIYPALAKAR